MISNRKLSKQGGAKLLSVGIELQGRELEIFNATGVRPLAKEKRGKIFRPLEVGGKILYRADELNAVAFAGRTPAHTGRWWVIVAASSEEARDMLRESGISPRPGEVDVRLLKVLQPRHWAVDGVPCTACQIVHPRGGVLTTKRPPASRRVQ